MVEHIADNNIHLREFIFVVVERVALLGSGLEDDIVVGSAERIERGLNHSEALRFELLDIVSHLLFGEQVAAVEDVDCQNYQQCEDVLYHSIIS